MRLRMLILAAALVLGQTGGSAQAPASRTTREVITTADVVTRGAPSASGPMIATVSRGRPLVVGVCKLGWCEVVGEAWAFISEGHVKTISSANAGASVAAPPAGNGYVNSEGERVPSPTRTPSGAPPAGATAQCRDC